MDAQHTANPQDEPVDDPVAQYLTFLLDEEVFAMDIRSVREIIQYEAMTPVPLMPDFVRGILNLRGAVVPVIDIKARFGWPQGRIGKKTCIVIFAATHESERADLGVLVDSVSEVIDVWPNQIEPAPQFGGIIQRDFIQGVGKVDGRFIVLLESERVLNIDDMASLVAQAGRPQLAAGG